MKVFEMFWALSTDGLEIERVKSATPDSIPAADHELDSQSDELWRHMDEVNQQRSSP